MAVYVYNTDDKTSMAIQRRDNLRVFGPIIAELKNKKKTNYYIHSYINGDHLKYSACID